MQSAVGYIRVSTTEQALDGVSLDAQKAKIQSWCTANGYELAHVHVDAGISGRKTTNRPALQAALADACETNGAALVVYSLSRLARSTKDAIAIAERLEKAGADLVSLSERIDTTSAAGKMIFRMIAVFAEFERDLISERVTAVVAYKQGRNERLGEIPYGFDLTPDGVTLVPNLGQQEVIASIQKLHSEGCTLRAIAAELTRRGVETKRGNLKWSHTTVASILSRKAA